MLKVTLEYLDMENIKFSRKDSTFIFAIDLFLKYTNLCINMSSDIECLTMLIVSIFW